MGATPQDPGNQAGGSADDSYSIFVKNMMGILAKAQTVGSTVPLQKSREQLQNQSLNLSNPMNSTPYQSLFAMMSPNQSVAAQQGTQSSFEPGLSSITDQINAQNTAMSQFGSNIQTAIDAQKPVGQPLGSALVSPGGKIVSPAFNPTIDPTTSLPYGYQTPAGQGGGSSYSGSGQLVGGVDFSGAATSTQPYATDPNYTKEVNAIYSPLAQNIPQPSAPSIDQYIESTSSKSRISGQMIMNAAQAYGIDPLILVATLQHESDLGTAGAGVSTNNPGNVQSGGRDIVFGSLQQGINADANELAKRMPGNVNAGKSAAASENPTTTALGGQFSQAAAQRVSLLPMYMQQFVAAGPQGVAYIDSTKLDQLPQSTQGAIQQYAAKAGIPWLDQQDVSNIKAIGNVYQAVQGMQVLIKENLNHGFLGGVWDSLKSGINSVTSQNAFPDLAKFNAYRDVAIKAVQALAGGSGSGLRLNTGEIMASTQTLADSGDSIETANNKISVLMNLLDTDLAGTFPYTQGQQPGLNGGSNLTATAGGKTYTFPNAQALAAFKAEAGIQ